MEKTCQKCGSTFNNYSPEKVWVDIRGRKYCWICKPYNSSNNKVLETRENKVCPRCNENLPIEQFYIKSHTGNRRKTTYCKQCIINYNYERELKFKIDVIKLKGGKCSKCGYDKNISALEFHHLDRNKKEFNFAHKSAMTDKLLKELNKCILVCSNCHREIENPDKNNLLK
jgi:hypothetical protein